MDGALLELHRHKTWATLRLIEHCRGLDDEHLEATIPGTYGTIGATLRLLVAAEEGYYAIVTGERLSPPLVLAPVAIRGVVLRHVAVMPPVGSRGAARPAPGRPRWARPDGRATPAPGRWGPPAQSPGAAASG